jgi:hypothetical protein
MPAEVVPEILRTAIDFPLSQNFEAAGIQNENAARSIAIGRTERADEDAGWTAVDGVWPTLSRASRNYFRFDDFDDFRFAGIRFRVNDVNPRRTDTRRDQVTPFRMSVRRVGAETCAAGVPAEVMQFVSGVGHIHLADELAVSQGRRIEVNHADRIGAADMARVQQRDVCQFFRWRLTDQFRGRIECRVRSPQRHSDSPWLFLPQNAFTKEKSPPTRIFW